MTVVQETDAALATRARAGDASAFGTLYERHRRFVSGIVCNYRLYDDREDLTHNAFLKAWDGLPKSRPDTPDNFKNWLARITVNVCLDYVRKLAFRNEKQGGLPTEWDDNGILSQAMTNRAITDPDPQPEDHVLQEERLRLTEELLDTLPERDANAVRMQASGVDLLAIARQTIVPYGTLKPRMFRVRAALVRRIVTDPDRYGPLDVERAARSLEAKLSAYTRRIRPPAAPGPLPEGGS